MMEPSSGIWDRANKLDDRFPDEEWILGDDPTVRRIAQHARRAASVGCTVLITGETGTGKEVWARQIHELGGLSGRPFVPVNCAALTATLAESQLFGHEKGAFTGALGAALGVFRAAQGGVVFLDEVGEMPQELQPKLLRVLQESEVTPVGSAIPVPVKVQIVAATNRNLEAEVAKGTFREDLYFRLNMVELNVPSLRERVQDIPDFIRFFSNRFAKQYKHETVWEPDDQTLESFCSYSWPGNIRQLSHVIEQSYVLDCAPMLPSQSDNSPGGNRLPFFDLAKLRSVAVRQALRATNGHKGRAAKLLGVHANTLTRMLAELKDQPDEEISIH
ncbi:MAG: sigma-54 dependent transcriptional regulator [Pirellulaceae bacterium]|nr:sigma-54 dependent transcriptional regulator [Pirellulaceae bacterium]